MPCTCTITSKLKWGWSIALESVQLPFCSTFIVVKFRVNSNSNYLITLLKYYIMLGSQKRTRRGSRTHSRYRQLDEIFLLQSNRIEPSATTAAELLVHKFFLEFISYTNCSTATLSLTICTQQPAVEWAGPLNKEGGKRQWRRRAEGATSWSRLRRAVLHGIGSAASAYIRYNITKKMSVRCNG